MRVLVVGSGGREHALCWAIAASPLCDRLYAAPGNPGIEELATCVPIGTGELDRLVEFARKERIDFVVVGPEAPLVAGLADRLEAADIATFGPSAAAAALEGSKGFTKDLCAKYAIPTAAYRRFTEAGPAKDFVRRQGAPIVVKADGLAAGKGVTVAADRRGGARRHRRSAAGATLRRSRGGARHRGIPGGRGSELLRPGGRRPTACCWPRRRITSASATATPAPTPAAWAPTRRRRASRLRSRRGSDARSSIPR